MSHTIHITACFAVENAVADGENAVAVGEARGSKCSLHVDSRLPWPVVRF